jgi:hypothetical protein
MATLRFLSRANKSFDLLMSDRGTRRLVLFESDRRTDQGHGCFPDELGASCH